MTWSGKRWDKIGVEIGGEVGEANRSFGSVGTRENGGTEWNQGQQNRCGKRGAERRGTAKNEIGVEIMMQSEWNMGVSLGSVRTN